MEKIRPKPNTTNARIRQSKEIASTRLPAIDGISYLADCHYTLIALVSVVFCVLLYAANKRSLTQNKHTKNLKPGLVAFYDILHGNGAGLFSKRRNQKSNKGE